MMQRLTSKAGAQIKIANNRLEAIEIVNQQDFDVILMDMQMPILDGYSATRQLRSQNYLRPIIALTAHAMAEEKKKTELARCNAHLTKPLDFALVVQTIHECLKLPSI